MPRLKSRNEFTPFGFRIMVPETGWDSWAHLPHRSFDTVVRAYQSHLLGNPWLVQKHSWPTDYDSCANRVDEYTSALCRNAGYNQFIEDENPVYAPPQSFETQKKTSAAGARRVLAGVHVLLDWLGDGGRPVAPELAEQRAQICATCPKNDGGDWKSVFTAPVAEMIRLQLAIRHDLELKTSVDDKLTVCSGCDCPLALKVFSPLEHNRRHLTEETKARLDPRCWVLNEP
jgi:hypothetical protein